VRTVGVRYPEIMVALDVMRPFSRPATAAAAFSEFTNALNSRIQWIKQVLILGRESGRFEVKGAGHRFPPFGQPEGRDVRRT